MNEFLSGLIILIKDNILVSISLGFVILALIIWVLVIIWKTFRSTETLKYEFITIIAHKYRTPLTQVKWLCENLLAKETDSFKKESLINIEQSNEKLIKLTNSLIEITSNDRSAIASYDFEVIPICELVRAVSEPFKDFFHEKNIFFSVQCTPELIRCKVDRPRIEFVIQSLLENARAYTSPGKNVSIIVDRISRRRVMISVIDDGIGIAKDELSRVFTKFFRSDASRRADTEGFGISLYLSKAIVRRNKGKIRVSSPGLGAGARFDVILKTVK